MPELMEFSHTPVLLKEAVDGLNLGPGAYVVDCTVGPGGHSRAILERTAPDGILIGMDADAEAISIARGSLEEFGGRVRLVHGNMGELGRLLADAGVEKVDGVLMDLGPSSYQIGSAERGFSFRLDGPLDMRMDRSLPETAAHIVNRMEARELQALIRDYGEERWAGRIARAVVRAREERPISSTAALAGIVSGAVPRTGRRRIHPATRTFMALRIATNHELENVTRGIPAAASALRSGGRLCVISFHSLEDRIVKTEFRRLSSSCTCPPEFPVCRCDAKPLLKVVTRKPVTPSAEEVASNRRARSAKLRIAERV